MKRFTRSERVSEEIRKELSQIIQHELKDPRIGGFVSVVRVETSKDLKNAAAYISVYGPEDEKNATMEALRSGSGYIRKTLGSRMRMRGMPELRFTLDDSMEYSEKIQRILGEIKSTDSAGETPPSSDGEA